jgi:hypothetical protein
MASFLSWLLGRSRAGAAEREAAGEGAASRGRAGESIEARRADLGAEEHGLAGLPQIDPDDELREPRV